MKQLLVFALMLFTFSSAQSQTTPKADVPKEVLTNDSTYWTITTLSNMQYVNTTPGAYYNTYKNGGGMIVKFKFKPGNRYEFMLYVQVNTYGIETETWTHTEGTVEFKKDSKGQQIMITKAEKGTYRTIKNGISTSRPIDNSQLEGQHSSTYIWERTTMKDDTKNDYLLMVDLEEHPNADVNKAGSIDPSWISKFHIPKS